MTQEELELKLKQIVKSININDKKQFLKDLKSINKKVDKLDKDFKNMLDKISLFFTFNLDKKIIRVIYDIAENIENPKFDEKAKSEIDLLIEKFLEKPENINEQSKEVKDLWKETKKVRKAL